MTDDITKNLSDSEKLDFLINAVSDTNRRLAALEERHIALEARQTDLEQLVRERLHDTRPLWHEVLQKLEAQQQQLDRLEQGQRRIEKKIALVHQDNLEQRADLALLVGRVETLENTARLA